MIKLTPLSNPTPLAKFAVVDIEARNWTELVVLGYFDGDNYLEFFSAKAFLEWLFSKSLKNTPQNVFAHFGGKYDFLFFIDAVIEMDGYEISNCIPRGSSLLSLDIEYGGRKISFRDTSAFLPFSLDRLTKKFGVEHKKKKFDFEEFNALKPGSKKYANRLKELRLYLKYDCKGLFEVIWKYAQNPRIKKAGFAYTSASLAIKLFRSYIDTPISGIYGAADQYIRKSYFGGRVEVFKPFFDNGIGTDEWGMEVIDKTAPNFGETLYGYDYNSLYPSCMADAGNGFPGGIEGITNKLDWNKPGFYWCKVFVPDQYMPPLPYLHQGKLIFPCGYLEGIWSVPELKNAVENYGVRIDRVKSGYRCHSIGNPFSDYIHDLYEERLKAKAEGDAITDIICKDGMNHLYGRFGLRKDRENFAFDENQKGFDGKWIIEKGSKNVRLGTIPIELTTSFSNIAIAAYVTSYGRIKNVNGAKNWAEKGLYYTDTDSYYSPLDLPSSKGLGELKREKPVNQACFLLPKTYLLKTSNKDFEITLEKDDPDNPTKTNKKVVMKGFNSRKIWRAFDIEHFKTALAGDLRLMQVTNDPKFATFKRALQKKKILTMLNAEIRGIKSKYSKRIVYKNSEGKYDTRPITINQQGDIKDG